MLSLIIISGRSGSGKSTALHVLEDMGYYCIDNLPVSLLPPLIERLSLDQQTDRVSVSIDARNLPRDLEQVEQLLRQIPDTVQSQIIFLDSASPTLVKRYSETRRKHPLSNEQRGLREALDYESELLAPLAEMAALNLDTTQLNIHQLRDEIRGRVAPNQQGFALLFVGFDAFRLAGFCTWRKFHFIPYDLIVNAELRQDI